ncbi:MAG TPA: regulatory protein RecX [Candidatus Dormibacteraeota bacterium]|jgi:SOS response regulatory protein OraA/RecX|nr:regulatory protein RecX [Candidatus Dormibacteraeota bacterium]
MHGLVSYGCSPLHSLVAPHVSYIYSSPMFGKQRKLDTEDELYDYALRTLMRRAHSVHEMKQKLMRRADSELLAQVVLARLKEGGKLDDARYAKQFTRGRTEVRKQGKYRIARDLRARGVPDRHINAAIAESAESHDEAAIVRQRIERKLRSFRGRGSGLLLTSPEMKKKADKKFASLYRSLLAAGFPSDIIRRELKSLTREELPDLDTTPEEQP